VDWNVSDPGANADPMDNQSGANTHPEVDDLPRIMEDQDDDDVELALADEMDNKKQLESSLAAVPDENAEKYMYLKDLCDYEEFHALVDVMYSLTMVILFHYLFYKICNIDFYLMTFRHM